MAISRRSFMQSASACFTLSIADCQLPIYLSAEPVIKSAVGNRHSAIESASPSDLEKTFEEIRATLLEMVNEERAVEKVPPVVMDELATQVATKHAIDMATAEYASHWGRDGLKPYHRYSFAGGSHATQENVSAADNTWSKKPADLKQDAAYLHVRLYQEKPPNDYHRRTILAPQHTHVGFGLALDQLRLRMVQLYVAKYAEVKPMDRVAKPRQQVSFAARMLRPEYLVSHIEVFYEPLPAAPELSWLRQPRPYSFPTEVRALKPKVPPPLTYTDGTQGVIEVSQDRTYSAPIKLYEDKPGIYTVVMWIKTTQFPKVFPATEVCIRTE